MEDLIKGAYVRGHLRNTRLTHTAQAMHVIDHQGNPVMPVDWDRYIHHSTTWVRFTLCKLEMPSGTTSEDIIVADIDKIRVILPSQTTNWRGEMGNVRR